MTKIEQLKQIRKDMFKGDLRLLAALSNVNSSVLLKYLKKCDTTDLRHETVCMIFKGYEKFKKEHR